MFRKKEGQPQSQDAVTGWVNSRVRGERPSKVDGLALGITWGDTHKIPQAEVQRRPIPEPTPVFDYRAQEATAARVDAVNSIVKSLKPRI